MDKHSLCTNRWLDLVEGDELLRSLPGLSMFLSCRLLPDGLPCSWQASARCGARALLQVPVATIASLAITQALHFTAQAEHSLSAHCVPTTAFQ